MTKEQTLAAGEVMMRSENGVPIQSRWKRPEIDDWKDDPNPNWNWADYEYRIKPTPREFWIVDSLHVLSYPIPGAVPAKLDFRHYSAHVINANDSAGTFNDMLEAGLKAAASLRAKAETEFRINIEVEGGLNTQKIALKAYRRFLAIAVACRNAKKPVKELTEEESFAICVACDVPCKSEGGTALLLKLETRAKCAIAWEDGQYVVYYAKG